MQQEIKEIVFVASGTSMNACKVTRYFSENECKIHVHFYYPNEFMNYFNYINKSGRFDRSYFILYRTPSEEQAFWEFPQVS